jgi:hypothetical protein
VEKENAGVEYKDYFDKGFSLNACYCGSKIHASDTATLEPVFVSRGLSVPTFEGAKAAVTQGIKVNRAALAMLTSVDFGLVVDVNVSKQKVAFSVKEYKQKLQRDEISQYMSNSNNNEDEAYTPFGDLLKTKN